MLDDFLTQVQADDFDRYEPTEADLAELHDEEINECKDCGTRIDPYALSPLCARCDAADAIRFIREQDFL